MEQNHTKNCCCATHTHTLRINTRRRHNNYRRKTCESHANERMGQYIINKSIDIVYNRVLYRFFSRFPAVTHTQISFILSVDEHVHPSQQKKYRTHLIDINFCRYIEFQFRWRKLLCEFSWIFMDEQEAFTFPQYTKWDTQKGNSMNFEFVLIHGICTPVLLWWLASIYSTMKIQI